MVTWVFSFIDCRLLSNELMLRLITFSGENGGIRVQRVAESIRSISPCYVSYLVDPASSHMLVSKIKPCMSKYKHLYCETANGSLNQLSFI